MANKGSYAMKRFQSNKTILSLYLFMLRSVFQEGPIQIMEPFKQHPTHTHIIPPENLTFYYSSCGQHRLFLNTAQTQVNLRNEFHPREMTEGFMNVAKR